MMKIFTTPLGKEVTTYREGNSVRVKFLSGGELPRCLQGDFTSPYYADQAIETFINSIELPKPKRG